MTNDTDPEMADGVRRLDRYRVAVNTVTVTATEDQEAILRALTAEQRARFEWIMGGPK